MPLEQRIYECDICGLCESRDFNSSKCMLGFSKNEEIQKRFHNNTGGTPEISYGQGEDSLELIEELSKQTVTV